MDSTKDATGAGGAGEARPASPSGLTREAKPVRDARSVSGDRDARDAEPARPASAVSSARAVYPAVAFISFSVILLQISITRVFAVFFFYHFVFVVVSSVMLGLGLGGFLRGLAQRSKPVAAKLEDLAFLRVAGPVAFSILSIAALFAVPLASGWSLLILAYAVTSLPFVSSGVFMSGVFAACANESRTVYAVDLSSAALAALAATRLMDLLTPPGAIVAAAGFGLALSIWNSNWPRAREPRWELRTRALRLGPRAWMLRLGLAILVLALFVSGIRSVVGWLDSLVVATSREGLHQQKTMFQVLRSGGGNARIVESTWDGFSRIDVVETADQSVRMVFMDGGAGSWMHRFNGDLESVQHLTGTPEFAALSGLKGRDILVIGAGAGHDLLIGLLSGARSITAIEVNRGLDKVMRRWSGFNGGIYGFDSVTVHYADGRSCLENRDGRYDAIVMNLVITQAAQGAYVLSEDYLFTREALETYLSSLNDGGRLVVTVHEINLLMRLAITALDVLTQQGIATSEATRLIAMFGRRFTGVESHPVESPVLVLQKEPFSEGQALELASLIDEHGFAPLHVPHLLDQQGVISSLATGRWTLEEFIANAPVDDIAPTTDDHPFFYKFFRGIPDDLSALLRAVVVLVIAASAAIVALNVSERQDGSAGPDVSAGRSRAKTAVPGVARAGRLIPIVLAFIGIGVGYMALEIGMVQRFTLLFGHPSEALAVVLFSLLAGSSLGSGVLAERLRKRIGEGQVVVLALAIVVAVSAVYALWVDDAVHLLFRLPRAAKMVLSMGLMAPLGAFMGIPFPMLIGMAARSESGERIIPGLWAANALSSVLGSLAAVAVALAFGYTFTLALGASVYAMALGAGLSIRRSAA